MMYQNNRSIMIKSDIIYTVYNPHGTFFQQNAYFQLEVVRNKMEETRNMKL